MSPEGEVPIRCRTVSAHVLRRGEGGWEVLLLRRAKSDLGPIWCQVAGRMEQGEKPEETAWREIREETSLRPDRFYSADICEQYYDHRRGQINVIPVFVAFLERAQTVCLNTEHSAHRWVSFEEARQLVPFAGQRQVLNHIEREFCRSEPSELLRIEPSDPA